jgi:hypothetical protein
VVRRDPVPAVDPYIAVRDAYIQYREKRVKE